MIKQKKILAPTVPHQHHHPCLNLAVEFHFAKPVVIRSVSIEDITTKHGSHHELLRYELQRWQASGWRTLAIHDHIDGSNIGGWQYLQNNVRGPDYLSQSWRIFFPPGVHVENKDRVHLGELTSLVTETYTAGSKPAEVNWFVVCIHGCPATTTTRDAAFICTYTQT